jgi:regulator of replication initiation timing
MKATVNLNQVLQGGLAGLVAWLFKTVNDLQQEVAVLMVQITDVKEDLMSLAMREQELNSAITEILIKLGG